MSDGVSLKLTPESRRLVNSWGADKVKDVERIIDSWLIRMQAWMLRETMKAFDDGKQPGGSSWPENVGRYAEWKASLGSCKPGVLSGKLRRSFAQNKKINKSTKEASIGSTERHAAFMFYGTSSGAAGMYVKGPTGAQGFFNFSGGVRARPYFPEQDYAERHAANLFIDLLKQKMKTA